MRPILSFDNSAFDQIVRDSSPESILSAITAGYHSNIPTMAFEESIATRNEERRSQLISVCRRLLKSGACLMPPHWIVDFHVKAFHKDRKNYDWRKVNVRAAFVEDEILQGTLENDEKLVAEQAVELRKLQDEFELFFVPSERRFDSFSEWLEESRKPGGSFWNTARLLYEGAFGSTDSVATSEPLTEPPSEEALREFLEACPPVRAFVYAFELTLYDRSLRADKRQSYKAGRNDQMMAAYLPYCDRFITNDLHQYRGFIEIAKAANIPVQVQLFSDFLSNHLIKAHSNPPHQ
jgi:hypothetical protein